MSEDLFSEGVIQIRPPGKTEKRMIRVLICAGLLFISLFCFWFFSVEHIGSPFLYCLLTFALIFKLVKMLHEWYHYWSIGITPRPPMKKEWKVDILTTSCPGEPRDLIVRTLKAMVAIKYPHSNYLCDEGDDPYLKEVCKQLGVVHVTRKEKKDAKAGNINNALKQATGEICVVLDPDHVPVPEFLHRVLSYFEDETVGYVQCIQAYGNQKESLIARGAAEQTYHFYGPMMMCMSSYNTVQAIGANCTFRRAALDSIGGHAAGLSEDMHTAMQIHAKGWKSIYVPEILTRGLVPATLSAYYKQQLKWSRGTFELLFRTLPSLFSNFTWRQKLHYLCIPMYFLHGLINFIDFLVPVLALCLIDTPWSVNVGFFVSYFVPLAMLSLMIRCYAQKWLAEPHERGFHLMGGVLRTATWWIFLMGFIYTIFNIKVPYIPTPKEDEPENQWRLCVPNIIVCGVILSVVAYGLYVDWSPYSLAMAGFALVNAGMLSFVILISQQKMLMKLEKYCNEHFLTGCISKFIFTSWDCFQTAFYAVFRRISVTLLVLGSFFITSYSLMKEMEDKPIRGIKETGGFYLGIKLEEEKESSVVNRAQHLFGQRLSVYSVDWKWEDENLPLEMLNQAKENNTMLLLNWHPAPDDENILTDIAEGKYDRKLQKLCGEFISYQHPVMLSFLPGFDSQNIKAKDYVNASRHLFNYFLEHGVSNVAWLWAPAGVKAHDYFPGKHFVDWIGTESVNTCTSIREGKYKTFTQIYSPFRKAYLHYEKPVMITCFGSCSSGLQDEWLKQGLQDMTAFKEVRGCVLLNGACCFSRSGDKQANRGFTPVSLSMLRHMLKQEPFSQIPFYKKVIPLSPAPRSHKNITGRPGNFTFWENAKPFYIRGVAYNTGHDWRDGNMPLTRKQVEADFAAIKAMGANTIRRYGSVMADRNILNIAAEYDLKVIFGFWFDPKVDYYRDTAKVREYMRQVETMVAKHKDHSAILAWSLGNETWGLLKHHYSRPYVVKVRESYVKMIEAMARRVHEIDPRHSVFSCMEFHETAGELVAFSQGAPSVDAMGVNSYYRELISRLHTVAREYDSLRPYIVSEFGPSGYWNFNLNRYNNGLLVEESEQEKADWYRFQWKNYIEAHKGSNIGGVAYCWHDRMEGSISWFGLADYRGRFKPSYHALKECWLGKANTVQEDLRIELPGRPGAGELARFEVRTKNRDRKFEWVIIRDYTYDQEDKALGERVGMRIPGDTGTYRVHVFASDENGNVSTATMPLKVWRK